MKAGTYGFRAEGMINPVDDNAQFNMELSATNNNIVNSTTRYKDTINPHAIVIDVETVLQADTSVIPFNLRLSHQVGREIARFLFGRRGAGRVDPMIIGNIDYSRYMIIPRYKSFEFSDRRYEVVVKSNFPDSDTPFENIVSNNISYQFKNNYIGDGTKFIMFCFPCLVSITSISLHQQTINDNGFWRFELFNETNGYWTNLTPISVSFNSTVVLISPGDNWSRRYRLVHVSGNIDKTSLILPVRFQLQKKTIII